MYIFSSTKIWFRESTKEWVYEVSGKACKVSFGNHSHKTRVGAYLLYKVSIGKELREYHYEHKFKKFN